MSGALSTHDLPRWRLDGLYTGPDSPDIARDIDWIGATSRAFRERYEGKLSSLDGEGLVEALCECEAIQKCVGKVGLYAHLRFCQDTGDSSRKKFLGDMQTQLAEATRPLVFFDLELGAIDESIFLEQLASSESLRRYRAWLDRKRTFQPHQLSEELERYLHDMSPVGSNAWLRLFETTFATIELDVEGEQLNLESALSRLQDPQRERRKAASTALTAEFRNQAGMVAHILNTLAKSKEVDDRWRKLPTPQSSRHLANAIEPEIVQALRDAVVEAYSELSHRYYRLKAGWLGLDHLETWDRNAPLLPKAEDKMYSWEEARALVLGAFRTFSPEFGKTAERFFDEGWIDAPSLQGKAPGAFSAPGPTDLNPFVMLNYEGNTRDLMVLAHELGHGVHQCLAAAQGEFLASTPLTLAETASVFGEMIVFRALIAKETDPDRRRALLATKAGDMLNTVARQISFYEFECRVHAARRRGELGVEDFGRIWLDISRESLGPAVHLHDGYENFWCYVGHFIHTPFYVYAYAFGDGLVNVLYSIYQKEPEGFEKRYLNMLRAGGSLHHRELLAPFGIDLREPGFWKAGLGVISDLIDEAAAT